MKRGQARADVRNALKRISKEVGFDVSEGIYDIEINTKINEALVDIARWLESELVVADLTNSNGRYQKPDDCLELKRVDRPDGTAAKKISLEQLPTTSLEPVDDFTPALPITSGEGWRTDFSQGYFVGDIGEALADHALVYNEADGLYHLIGISARYWADPANGFNTYTGRQFTHLTSTDRRNWARRDDIFGEERWGSGAWNDVAVWAPNISLEPTGKAKYIMHYTGVGGGLLSTSPLKSDAESIGVAYSNDLFTWWEDEGNPVFWGGKGQGNLVGVATEPEMYRGGWGADMVVHFRAAFVCRANHLSAAGAPATNEPVVVRHGGNAYALRVGHTSAVGVREPGVAGWNTYWLLIGAELGTELVWADGTAYSGTNWTALEYDPSEYTQSDNTANLPAWQDATNYETFYQYYWPFYFWTAVTRDPGVFYDPGTKKWYLLHVASGVSSDGRYYDQGKLGLAVCTDTDNAMVTWEDDATNGPLIDFGSADDIESPHILPVTNASLGRVYHLTWTAPNSSGSDYVKNTAGTKSYVCQHASFNKDPDTAANQPHYWKEVTHNPSYNTWNAATYYEPSGTHHQSQTSVFGGGWGNADAGVGKSVTGRRGDAAGEQTLVDNIYIFSCHRVFYQPSLAAADAEDWRYYYRFGELDYSAITAVGEDPAILTIHPAYSGYDTMTGVEGKWNVLNSDGLSGTLPITAFDYNPTWGGNGVQAVLDDGVRNITGSFSISITGNSYVATFEGYSYPDRASQEGEGENHQRLKGPDYGYGGSSGNPGYDSVDPRGVAVSESFTIQKNRIKVRVGGGNRPITTAADYGKPCVVCLVRLSDHEILFAETGEAANTDDWTSENHWNITTRLWDTETLVGTDVYCAIVDLCDSDTQTIKNGHIICDLIEEYGEAGNDDDSLTLSTPSTQAGTLQEICDYYGYTGNLDNEF